MDKLPRDHPDYDERRQPFWVGVALIFIVGAVILYVGTIVMRQMTTLSPSEVGYLCNGMWGCGVPDLNVILLIGLGSAVLALSIKVSRMYVYDGG